MTLARLLLLVTLSTGCASVSQNSITARDPAHSPRQTEAASAVVAGSALSASETSGLDGTSTRRDTFAHARGSVALRHNQNAVPLRHFYLLSPGPNATLVVTRSDLQPH
ncbi:MAG: hypothetical protein ABI488_21510 [Polyangiaceae bacterium]